MKDWISVEDELPKLGEWVNVLCDVGAYSELDGDGCPVYWFEGDYYMYLALSREMISVTSATLRFIDEGWGTWQQGELGSGSPLRTIEHVSHWMSLPKGHIKRAQQDILNLRARLGE